MLILATGTSLRFLFEILMILVDSVELPLILFANEVI